MSSDNRMRIAREVSGLSIGQAARLMGRERIEIEELESAPATSIARDVAQVFASYYRVDVAWMLGETPLRDYETIKNMRGSENLSNRDRDILAEFAASLPRGKR